MEGVIANVIQSRSQIKSLEEGQGGGRWSATGGVLVVRLFRVRLLPSRCRKDRNVQGAELPAGYIWGNRVQSFKADTIKYLQYSGNNPSKTALCNVPVSILIVMVHFTSCKPSQYLLHVADPSEV